MTTNFEQATINPREVTRTGDTANTCFRNARSSQLPCGADRPPTREELLAQSGRFELNTEMQSGTVDLKHFDTFMKIMRDGLGKVDDRGLQTLFDIGQALKNGRPEELRAIAQRYANDPIKLMELGQFMGPELARQGIGDRYQVVLSASGAHLSLGSIEVMDRKLYNQLKWDGLSDYERELNSQSVYQTDGRFSTPESRREH